MTTPLCVHASYSIDRNLGCLSIQCDRTDRFLIGKAVVADQLKNPMALLRLGSEKSAMPLGVR